MALTPRVETPVLTPLCDRLPAEPGTDWPGFVAVSLPVVG